MALAGRWRGCRRGIEESELGKMGAATRFGGYAPPLTILFSEHGVGVGWAIEFMTLKHYGTQRIDVGRIEIEQKHAAESHAQVGGGVAAGA